MKTFLVLLLIISLPLAAAASELRIPFDPDHGCNALIGSAQIPPLGNCNPMMSGSSSQRYYHHAHNGNPQPLEYDISSAGIKVTDGKLEIFLSPAAIASEADQSLPAGQEPGAQGTPVAAVVGITGMQGFNLYPPSNPYSGSNPYPPSNPYSGYNPYSGFNQLAGAQGYNPFAQNGIYNNFQGMNSNPALFFRQGGATNSLYQNLGSIPYLSDPSLEQHSAPVQTISPVQETTEYLLALQSMDAYPRYSLNVKRVKGTADKIKVIFSADSGDGIFRQMASAQVPFQQRRNLYTIEWGDVLKVNNQPSQGILSFPVGTERVFSRLLIGAPPADTGNTIDRPATEYFGNIIITSSGESAGVASPSDAQDEQPTISQESDVPPIPLVKPYSLTIQPLTGKNPRIMLGERNIVLPADGNFYVAVGNVNLVPTIVAFAGAVDDVEAPAPRNTAQMDQKIEVLIRKLKHSAALSGDTRLEFTDRELKAAFEDLLKSSDTEVKTLLCDLLTLNAEKYEGGIDLSACGGDPE